MTADAVDVSEQLPALARGSDRGVHAIRMQGDADQQGSGSADPLLAPFPWFGGKRKVAARVWERLGDVPNFCEPFAGSTVNDIDSMLANFFRCLTAMTVDPAAPRFADIERLRALMPTLAQEDADAMERMLTAHRGALDPDEVAAKVAAAANRPVNEADLHAIHRHLVGNAAFRERMKHDPYYFDPEIAGLWVWGLCAWIGSGWCDVSRLERDANARPFLGGGEGHHGHGVNAASMRDPSQQIPLLSSSGQGVNAVGMRNVPEQLPDLHCGGQGVNALKYQGPHQKIPAVDTAGMGVHSTRHQRSALVDTFLRLAARLRYVRVTCGDWRRILTDSVTWRHGTTGVFLDPPYGSDVERADVYAHDSGTIAADVRTWCAEHGADTRLKIVLAGYAGEGHEALEKLGWTVEAWKAHGGYGGQRKDGTNDNAHRERLWYSPGCNSARQQTLF